MVRKLERVPAVVLLPVRFVIFVVGVQYLLFVLFWCVPALQLDVDQESRNINQHRKGLVVTVSFHVIVVMFGWSFYRTMTTDPGKIPNTREWTIVPDPLKLKERRPDGQLRYCKNEKKFKPDRCHYCRQMQRNILRMDHFCPWVANGIGFYNYKYFLLTLFYACLCLGSSTWFMGSAFFSDWNNYEVSWGTLYFNFVGTFLGVFFSVIVFPFFCFHLWLTSKNMTTIEWCEIEGKRRTPQNYNLGCCIYNFAAILGINPHFWFWPVPGPIGNGLTYERHLSHPSKTKNAAELEELSDNEVIERQHKRKKKEKVYKDTETRYMDVDVDV